MSPPPRICLLTSGHVASTPRLVRNARALTQAGYAVRIISTRLFPPADALDATVLAAANWRHTRIDGCRGIGPIARKILRRLARRLIGPAPRAWARLAARAHHAESMHLAAAAARAPADLYFGHCLAGLPAAAFAARRRHVPYGFDAEDLHDADTFAAMTDPIERKARSMLHAGLLPGCALFTCAAPLIGRRYAADYHVAVPLTLLNVFPRADSAGPPPAQRPVSNENPVRAYWFSQTIGPGRGLETALAVFARMHTPVEMRLRGFSSPGYLESLRQQAAAAGLRRPPVFLPPGPPDAMVRLAAEADLGLAIEERQPLNHDLCLANKIFAYLLAGIPQWLSATAAHAGLAEELGTAALLGDLGRPDETAAMLDAFFSAPDRVAASRQTAWKLGQTRFNWDLEGERLVAAVRTVVGPP